MATPEQLAIIKSNPNMPVRKLAEKVGMGKSQVAVLQKQVASVSTNGELVIVTKRA